MRLTTTMTVLQVGNGELVVHSPLAVTEERWANVHALGRVAHLYAPNTYHHLWLGDWSAALPGACVHAPAALAAKRPGLRIDRFHDEVRDSALGDAIDEIPIRGFRLAETVLVHRAAATAVVADLVHNVGRPEDPWTQFYTKVMGFYDRVALSRAIRWFGFNDRAAARLCIDALLEHSFDRLIMGHGVPIAGSARDVLQKSRPA